MFNIAFYAAISLLLLYTVWQLVNLWGWGKTVGRPVGTSEMPDLTRAEARAWRMKSYGLQETLTTPPPNHRTTLHALPSIALLVPFRNEVGNLPGLAASLLAQDYPGELELIFIDDHSTDGGGRLLPPEVTLLKLEDYLRGQPTVAHKKAALTYAISSTSAEVIITTDADCYWPADRVSRIAQVFSAGADVVLGPVLISPTDGFCNAFQALDLAAYQFLTAATAHQGRPALANGANFTFRRQLFTDVGGYTGVDHLPSGDDVLLLHKFYQPRFDAPTVSNDGLPTTHYPLPTASNDGLPTTHYPLPTASKDGLPTTHHPPPTTVYASRASVTTKPVLNWLALWRQRLRWAGKAGNYNNPRLSFAQALTFALSAAIVLSLLTLPLHLRPRLIILLWGGKALIDLLCLWPVMKHFGQSRTMKWYPLAAIIYPFFLVGVGTAALLGFTTKWKGRR